MASYMTDQQAALARVVANQQEQAIHRPNSVYGSPLSEAFALRQVQLQRTATDLEAMVRFQSMTSSRRRPASTPTPIHIERLLSFPTATLYGSRALHVNDSNSDYDIAFSHESSSIYGFISSLGFDPGGPNRYFKVAPESGYHSFYQVPIMTPTGESKADILIVNSDEDLDCIRSSIQDLLNIPSYLLVHKHIRIELYQKALLHRNWHHIKQRTVRRQPRAMGDITSFFRDSPRFFEGTDPFEPGNTVFTRDVAENPWR